ncbi:pentatricopeptide repeat-containing protein At5g14080-like [Chenopodium quinoa]|uniref:pentatricopeptide repeat-containing protein At5g14080-like n=1 Tax=Chenopodium quinoa TaxID=63459 RepID=UPI000B76F05A|nr:pentatricopeptide repeat-containing protein At5g14080-like [Chenopodium quinoa]
MQPPVREAATQISRALISASSNSKPIGSWTRSLEQTLHQLGCRDSLNPSLVARVIDPHLLRHPSLSLGFFNWAAQQPNFSHSSISYHSILKSLSISRQFNSLEKVLKEAKSRNFAVDPSFYRPVVASLVKSKKSHEGFLILKDVESSIFDVGAETCNSLLAGLVSEGRIDCARKLFDEMLVRGVSFNTLGIGLFMWRFCRDYQMDIILGALDRVRIGVSRFDGSIVALLILHGLCEVGRVTEAYNALEELRNRDCKPDFMAYRVVAEAFRSKGPGCIFEVQAILKKKRKLGVAPRASDYREFIFTLLSENLIYEAKLLGLVILEGNFPIEDDALNALIGSVSLVDSCSAMLFFKFMLERERMPDLITLSNLSRNLYKHGKSDDMLDVFNVLSSKDYFTNLESYYVMVSSMCEAGKVREAYGVLQEMRRKGLFPDISFFNVLMEALCGEDLIRPAKKLWDEMFAYGVDGNLKTYNILIKKFAEIGQIDEAQVLFDNMLKKGVMPDAVIYIFLLECLCQNSKFEAAIQIFYKVADQDITIAQAIVNPLILSLCKGGCLLYASKFLCSNCHLRHKESHVILLKYLAEAQQFETAVDHLKQVMAASPSLLQEISTEILALLACSSNPEPILQLIQEMQHNEFVPMNDKWKAISRKLLTSVSGLRHPL